jgi:hypothetical protein
MSVAADLIRAQRAWLDKRQRSLTAQQQQIVARAIATLTRELDEAKVDTWTMSSRARVLGLILDLVNRMRGSQTLALRRALAGVSQRAWRDVARYMGTMDAAFGGPRVLPWESLDFWAARWGPYDTTRLRVYRGSFRRYGAATVADIEVAVGQNVLLGRSWTEAREEVMRIAADKIQGRQWMADRILRTETAAAYSATTLQALHEEDEPDDPMQKMLIAIWDQRTAADSKQLHGQIRDLDKMFFDPTRGREFRAPPNRPNDRELPVGWRKSWGDPVKFVDEMRASVSHGGAG